MARKSVSSGFPKTATATIELDKNDRIVVKAADGTLDEIRVAPGGTVVFKTPTDSPFVWWSVLFVEDTPFQTGKPWCSEKRGRQKSIRVKTGGQGAPQKHFSFAIVASDGTKVYFRDPEVIVGPGGG